MIKEIIPTIFALDKKTFEEKLEKLSFAKKLHLDFMDGKFINGKSVSIDEMEKIIDYKKIDFEIHLMAEEPAQYISQIKKLGIKKVLIQEEVFKKEIGIENCIKQFKQENLEIFIVLNPATNFDKLLRLKDLIDGIMIMSVWPGKEGQEFIEKSYLKIEEIKTAFGDSFPIQIDGGINESNISEIIGAGADILSIGSAISSKKDPRITFEKLNSFLK